MKKFIPSLGFVAALLVWGVVLLGIFLVSEPSHSSLILPRNSVVCDGQGHWGYVDSFGSVNSYRSREDAVSGLNRHLAIMKEIQEEKSYHWKVCHE